LHCDSTPVTTRRRIFLRHKFIETGVYRGGVLEVPVTRPFNAFEMTGLLPRLIRICYNHRAVGIGLIGKCTANFGAGTGGEAVCRRASRGRAINILPWMLNKAGAAKL
jgi:hypothetical protein